MRRILVPLDGTGAAEAAVKEIEAICEPGDDVERCRLRGVAETGADDAGKAPSRPASSAARQAPTGPWPPRPRRRPPSARRTR